MPPPIVPGIPMRNSRPAIPYFDASLDIVMSNAPHSAYKLKSNGFIAFNFCVDITIPGIPPSRIRRFDPAPITVFGYLIGHFFINFTKSSLFSGIKSI